MKIAVPVRVYCCVFFLAFLLPAVTAHGQADNDSYAYTLQHSENDAQKLTAYENILKACRFSKPDSAILLINKGITEFTLSSYQKGIASLLTYQGIIYSDQNNTDLAQKSLEKSIHIYKGLKDYTGLASSHNIIGVMLSRKGNFSEASDHLFKSVKIFESINDSDGITNTFIKIGENYERWGNYGNALEYYVKGINIAKDLPGNDLVMLKSSNIPSVLKDMKDNFISMKKLQKILDVNGKNNSFVEVWSLPDAIKDAIYTMDGDTAKTLNYTRYALNLLLKNFKSNIYEEFSLTVKDNMQSNPDKGRIATEHVDIAPLLALKNQKKNNPFVKGANIYSSNNTKREASQLNPIQVSSLINHLEKPSDPYAFSTMPIQENMNTSPFQVYSMAGNSLLNLTAIWSSNNTNIISSSLTMNPGNQFNSDNARINYSESNEALYNNLPATNYNKESVTQNQRTTVLFNPAGLADAATAYDPNKAAFNFNLSGNTGNILFHSGTSAPPVAAQNQISDNQYHPETGKSDLTTSDSRMSLSAVITMNNNNRLNETLKIVSESVIKKNEARNLDGLIDECKRKGDFITATALLEKQKSIQDSIIYLETELARNNIESLNNINVLNSKVQQLESLDLHPQTENNLPLYIAVFLSIIVLITSLSWGRTKLVNKELAKREMKLLNANNVKNKLISVIAHDITGSIGFMPLSLGLCRDKSIAEEDKDALLYQLELNAVSSFKTLQNMLDWAKAQIQGNILNQQKINLNDTLSDVLQSISVAANQKNITIVNNITGDVYAYADPNHIKFVLRNLISNAVKYSNMKGIIGISSTFSKDGKQIITSVSDNGIGISKENIKYIFEPTSISKSSPENVMSNGIGLSLCKEFVIENGGEIWVDSEKGKGSVFHFTMKADS